MAKTIINKACFISSNKNLIFIHQCRIQEMQQTVALSCPNIIVMVGKTAPTQIKDNTAMAIELFQE